MLENYTATRSRCALIKWSRCNVGAGGCSTRCPAIGPARKPVSNGACRMAAPGSSSWPLNIHPLEAGAQLPCSTPAAAAAVVRRSQGERANVDGWRARRSGTAAAPPSQALSLTEYLQLDWRGPSGSGCTRLSSPSAGTRRLRVSTGRRPLPALGRGFLPGHWQSRLLRYTSRQNDSPCIRHAARVQGCLFTLRRHWVAGMPLPEPAVDARPASALQGIAPAMQAAAAVAHRLMMPSCGLSDSQMMFWVRWRLAGADAPQHCGSVRQRRENGRPTLYGMLKHHPANAAAILRISSRTSVPPPPPAHLLALPEEGHLHMHLNRAPACQALSK